MTRRSRGQAVLPVEYRRLAEFRYQIRRFLRFSESVARSAGLEPQQHQLLLAIKGAGDEPLSIGELADRLQVRHHSAVGLVDRLEGQGLVRRARASDDRRRVLVELTRKGEALIADLSRHHLAELRSAGPGLVEVLAGLLDDRPSRSKPG
ncbi:MAG: MarR family winged helix-turn-helix transcriptional regulator [Acidobacteriota bacterium]